jgi:hypothetical protein
MRATAASGPSVAVPVHGFSPCGICAGGLPVRNRSHGQRRAFFYRCTSHFTRGEAACRHVDQWPIEEIDAEVLGTIADAVLDSALVDEITTEARAQYEARRRVDPRAATDDLESVEGRLLRLTDAIATSTERVPALIFSRAVFDQNTSAQGNVRRTTAGGAVRASAHGTDCCRSCGGDWRELVWGIHGAARSFHAAAHRRRSSDCIRCGVLPLDERSGGATTWLLHR